MKIGEDQASSDCSTRQPSASSRMQGRLAMQRPPASRSQRKVPALNWGVGCCTARPCPPPLAVGTLGAQQLARLEAVLADPRLEERCRVVGLHHPPQPGAGSWHNRLTDAAPFRKILARQGAELVLHGHLHRELTTKLPGPREPVAVRGVGSVSVCEGPPHRLGQLLVFRVRGRDVVAQETWRYDPHRREFLHKI